ncbi:MAG: multidrug MFS transporter [Spongiibacter sp.]|uniref:sugar transferase n=1 Tax=Spongiibacter sp. TaxID=2024860 RepID=UPI000C0A82F1|nr:sugar transferase [Spongiibacter sp.]MAK42842.1 multidrug MFS transporter [Spongiibacter sp.]|tara:strand:+ start:928 stop:1617 length:690 start_codon:yes stop_codon:yes gene_type:complete
MQAIKNQVSSAYLIFISSLFMPAGLSLRKFLRSGYKRSYDIVLSGGLLLLLSPLLVVTAAAILFESRGPIFFRQLRVGKNGEQFSIYKFRSMCTDRALHRQVESMSGDRDGICKKFVNDPRVTRVGQFIRKYSIDELPQLINVLRGEMSMIGPRPALPAEVAQYSEYQRGRLKALPGISGLWQVSGRADLNFDQQVELDLQYIRQQSLATDLRIALKTVPAVLSGSGAY